VTGEMDWIRQSGVDSNRNEWKLHAAIAKAVGGKLYPFDDYRGPFILVGKGKLYSEMDYYRYPVKFPPGLKRLWIFSKDNAFCWIWREDTNAENELFPEYATEFAIAEAKRLLGIDKEKVIGRRHQTSKRKRAGSRMNKHSRRKRIGYEYKKLRAAMDRKT